VNFNYGAYDNGHEGHYIGRGGGFHAPEDGTALSIGTYTIYGPNGTRASCNLAIDGNIVGDPPAIAEIHVSSGEATLTAMTRQPVDAGDHDVAFVCDTQQRVYSARGQVAVYGS
jgi:hypothetical protein